MSKFAIILSEEAVSSLANHADKTDVNKSHAYHRDRLSNDLNKTEQKVLFLISTYSVKYPGVSYMSKSTMADKLECSPRTIQRAIGTLAELGAIEVFSARRKAGDKRQTANVLRLVRRPDEPVSEAVVSPENCGFDSPLDPNLNPKTLNTNTFEADADRPQAPVASVTKKELASAYDIPEQIVYATNALRLSDRKFIELFANNGAVLRDALFKHVQDVEMTPYLVRWDLTSPAYLKCLQSAAVRTAYVAKHYGVKNVVGYFVRTYCDLIEKEMAVISAA